MAVNPESDSEDHWGLSIYMDESLCRLAPSDSGYFQ